MKKKKGRPKRKIDLALVKELSEIQCTISEISAVMNIPESTLKTRPDFSTTYKSGLEVGKKSLRRIQFDLAKKSAGMAIWLGKQYLNQTEKIEVTNDELMREEIEIVTKRYRPEIKNRLSQFISN